MRFHNHRSCRGHHPEHRNWGCEDTTKEMFFKHRHGGSHGGFGGRGEGGKHRFFERGAFKFALLELLESKPMHGYQLIKAMEEKTGGLYTPSAGSVYPNLQLLEDMQLISSSETDGKKLYQITEEGLANLRERGEKEAEHPANRWECQGRHRQSGGHGKRHLRSLMKDWSDVIHLMARAAEAGQENLSSKQTEKFQELMSKLQEDLKDLLASIPAEADADALTDNNQPDNQASE